MKKQISDLAKFKYENELWNTGLNTLAGIDEVGRGPIAGPLVTACVIFTKDNIEKLLNTPESFEKIMQIDDSKKLTDKKREILDIFIKANANRFGIFCFDSQVIDKQGIGVINELGLTKAAVFSKAEHVLVDHFKLKSLNNTTSITKGDSKSFLIACASIIAKVYRDRLMCDYNIKFPGYQFEKHKGYGTSKHIETISRLGYCSIHRRSFNIKI